MDPRCEIEAALRRLRDPARAKASASILCTPLTLLGIPVPAQRARLAQGFSFSALPAATQDRIWETVFLETGLHEAGNLALMHFEARKSRLSPSDWPRLKRLARHVRNWEHADRVADLLAQLHERHPHTVYPTLKEWREDANAWLRRLSLTSLFYYSRARMRQPALARVLPLVEALIPDANLYVQKAVGWTLRECGNVYPKETLAFLRRHATALSATAFAYATEKLPAASRAPLLRARRTQRFRHRQGPKNRPK